MEQIAVTGGTATARSQDTARVVAAERPPLISEDWLAVLIGGALLALVVLGVRPAMPRFAWGTGDATAAGLVSAVNLGRTLQMSALVLVPLIAGAALLGARLTAFLPGVLLLYALAWLAQAMAGHATSAAWGLEYVIYGLAIGLVVSHTVRLPGWFRRDSTYSITPRSLR